MGKCCHKWRKVVTSAAPGHDLGADALLITGCLTLLEIYWNNFFLLEILEIYWKLAKSSGNFLAEFVCLLLYDAKFLYFTVYQ